MRKKILVAAVAGALAAPAVVFAQYQDPGMSHKSWLMAQPACDSQGRRRA